MGNDEGKRSKERNYRKYNRDVSRMKIREKAGEDFWTAKELREQYLMLFNILIAETKWEKKGKKS